LFQIYLFILTNQDIVFIINPKAGKGHPNIKKDIENAFINNTKKPIILFTERKNHAKEIVVDFLSKNCKHFVAVGGDGTVNEVASQLINSGAVLSIIPVGSGNGLARALGLSLRLDKALETIIQKTVKTIDCGTVNEIPFFCTMGIGFDAYCAAIFDKGTHQRGLINYIKIILKSYFDYKSNYAELNDNETEFFSITFANANQFGNNAYIAPDAVLDSTFLDCTVIGKHPKVRGFELSYRLMNKSILASKYVSYFRAKTYQIKAKNKLLVHIDGESYMLETNQLTINTLPGSLIVTV
jgi:diacylglycerol kinase (ATP)